MFRILTSAGQYIFKAWTRLKVTTEPTFQSERIHDEGYAMELKVDSGES